MKIVSILSVLTLLFALSQAQASGCGSYIDSRENLKREPIQRYHIREKYIIESLDATTAVVRVKDSSQKMTLEWVSSTHLDADYYTNEFQENDVFFQEGHGCGPIYRCITGQVVLTYYDQKKMSLTTYAYPRIVDVGRSDSLQYHIAASPLLPIFGKSMRLDGPPLGPDHINGDQCGYGDW